MKCKICNRQTNTTYCSIECKEEAELKKHLIRVSSHKCAKCGGQTKYSIRTYKNHLDKYKRNVYSFNKYCSNCVKKKYFLKTKINFKNPSYISQCDSCGKDFKRSNKRIKNICHSCKARDLYRSKKNLKEITKKCLTCGEEFKTYKPLQKYCNMQCRIDYRYGLPNTTTSNK